MAALLILFLLTDGVADGYGRNRKRENPHDRGEHIRVRHRASPFAFVVHERDEKPGAICCPSGHGAVLQAPRLLYYAKLCRSSLPNSFSICSVWPRTAPIPHPSLFPPTRPPRAGRTPPSARNRNIVAKFGKIHVEKWRHVWYIYG